MNTYNTESPSSEETDAVPSIHEAYPDVPLIWFQFPEYTIPDAESSMHTRDAVAGHAVPMLTGKSGVGANTLVRRRRKSKRVNGKLGRTFS